MQLKIKDVHSLSDATTRSLPASASRLLSELYAAPLGDEVLMEVECVSSEPSLDWLPLRRAASTCSLAPREGWDSCF